MSRDYSGILRRLGHSILYGMVCRIEIIQAQLSQEFLKTSNMPPLERDHEGVQFISLY